MNSAVKNKKLWVSVYWALLATVIIALTGFLVYLSLEENPYTEYTDTEFRSLEKQVADLIVLSKSKPNEALKGLESLPELPKLLKNRKNYILSNLYEDKKEYALAFISANNIDENYLSQFSSSKKSRLANRIGLESVVMKSMNYLHDVYPEDPSYIYEIAKSYARQSLIVKAIEKFNLIQKNYPNTEYAIGAEYYLANLSPEPQTRFKRLSKYLKLSPDGSLSSLVADQIIKMREKYSETENGESFSITDLRNDIALAFYEHDDFKRALQYFDRSLAKESGELDKVLPAIITSLEKIKQKSRARQILMTELPNLQDKKIAKSLLETLLRLSPNKYLSLSYLAKLKDKMPDIEDKILWEKAKRSKKKEDYLAVYTKYPYSFYSPASMAKVFWAEYKRKSYHKALEIAKEHWNKYPYSESHPQVAFWAAKIHLKQAKTKEEGLKEAQPILQNLIISHPRDFYSFRAKEILANHEKIIKEKWWVMPGENNFVSDSRWTWPQTYEKQQIKSTYGADILELCNIHQFDYLLSLENKKGIKFDKNFKMWLFAQAGNYLKAISTAYWSLDKNADVTASNLKFQYAFPLAFAGLVSDESGKNNKVDPLLAHALIRQESRYQRDVISRAGAIGLMQIMPYTAKYLARSHGMPIPNAETLMQPETNIKLGIKYMEEIFARFENNMIEAIASYNAGPVAVSNWTKKYSKDPDEFIEEIPYRETKNYVKRVLNNYWIYRELYS